MYHYFTLLLYKITTDNRVLLNVFAGSGRESCAKGKHKVTFFLAFFIVPDISFRAAAIVSMSGSYQQPEMGGGDSTRSSFSSSDLEPPTVTSRPLFGSGNKK